MSQNIKGLDEAIRKFKDYLQGNGDFDELDFKEFIVDSITKSQVEARIDELENLLSYVNDIDCRRRTIKENGVLKQDLQFQGEVIVAKVVVATKIKKTIAELKDQLKEGK